MNTWVQVKGSSQFIKGLLPNFDLPILHEYSESPNDSYIIVIVIDSPTQQTIIHVTTPTLHILVLYKGKNFIVGLLTGGYKGIFNPSYLLKY